MPEEKKPIRQECKHCGGVMRFDPSTCCLTCVHCGNREILNEAPDHEELSFEGFDFEALNEGSSDENTDNLPIYVCQSCGAEVITPPEQAALTCPYCGSNIVLTDKISGRLRPDGIVPFKIPANKLQGIMKEYCKGKKLVSKYFFSDGRMSKVTGVYVPFWVFDGTVTGQLTYNGSRSSSFREGDYDVTETDYYKVVRDVSADFKDLSVNASRKTDDALMDSLEPFDLSEAVPFDFRFLAGFTADRFDVACEDIKPRAVARMSETLEQLSYNKTSAEYSDLKKTGGSLTGDLKARYLLLPAYFFEISHAGKNYLYAVNGQTGKVIGTLPKDFQTSLIYFLKRAAIIMAVLIVGFIISYFIRK